MPVPKLLIGALISLAVALLYHFFVFTVDYTRTEYVQYEDDDYVYYVKAVPKIKVTEKNRNVTNIKSEENEDDLLFDDITEDSDLPDKDWKEAEKE